MGRTLLMLAAAAESTEKEWLPFLILGCVIVGILLVFLCIWAIKRAKRLKHSEYADSVKVSHGVRYSKDDAVKHDGEMNVSHSKGDFILQQGVTYTAKKKSELMPGTYTALSASGSSEDFKVRVGGYVQTYKHGDIIVLADGEKICAVSANVILR